MSMIERAPHRRAMAGFTLIEGVIVITLISVLAAVAGLFIVQPFSAARDISRRAELTDAAETALDRMTREIRLAVPNSVRLADTDSDGDENALEFLRSSTGGRYRRLHAPGGGGETLDPTLASDTFDVLGGINTTPYDSVDDGGAGRNCADRATPENDCLVISNTATAGFDAYDKDNVAAITNVDTGNDTMTFDADAAPAFPAHSSNQRFQVLDTVVSYICQNSRIDRFFDYGLESSQPKSPGGTPDLLASDVMACNFAYDSGAGQRHGLVTIDITIQRGGETVRLIDQAHVVNVP
jgi:MSHA biogenesis protein MshO